MKEELQKNHQTGLISIPTFLSENYEFANDSIGQGGFGVVLKATHRFEKEDCAIKLISFMGIDIDEAELKENIRDTMNEIQIFKSLNHPNIIKYKTSMIFQKESIFAIVMELAEKSVA